MITRQNQTIFSLMSFTLCVSLSPKLAIAQITAANDAIGTTVNPQGQQLIIDGGQTTIDGNLLHSFETFNLTHEQTAQFITTPETQNILSRIIGGEASQINGLIEVVGSQADLFLLNPAGIIFGESARLNVPGDFIATTAIAANFELGEFAVNPELDTTQSWSNLLGEPTGLTFATSSLTRNLTDEFTSETGAIVNLGNLAVHPGQNLNLWAGTVINTGTLTGGQISLAAVPGSEILRLSAAGNVLALEVNPEPNSGYLTPIALPELLTGGNLDTATTLDVVDGMVHLGGAVIEPGDTLVTGSVNVAGDRGGVAQILGDRVLLSGATIDASGVNGGGAIYVGGDYRGLGTLPTAEFTVVDPTSRLDVSAIASGDGGEAIVWADGTAGFFGEILARGGASGGDGGFVETSGSGSLVFRGAVDLTAPQGVAGSLLLDPTNITISSSVSNPSAIETQITNPFAILAADYNGQDVTINSAFLQAITGDVTLEATNDITLTSNLTFSGTGSITFKADSDQSGSGAFIATNSSITAPGRNLTITGNGIDINSIDTSNFVANSVAGNVTLNSTNNVILGMLYASGGAGGTAGVINIQAGGNLQKNGGISEINLGGELGGSITINTAGNVNFDTLQGQGRPAVTVNSGGSITLSLINTRGGDVSLITTAGNIGSHDITVTNQISTAINNFSSSTQAGNVTVTSAGGISATSIDASNSSSVGNNLRSGNITLSALNAIDINQFLNTSASGNNARSGNISVPQSESFNIGTSINSMTNGTNSISGAINIQSSGAILGYEMLTYSFGSGSQSGNIIINGSNFNFNNIQAQSSQTAGNVAITTTGDLTIADLLLTPSSGATGTGGNITLTSGGNLTANRVFSTAIGNAGDISFQTGGNLNLGNSGFINALSVSGDAGNVILQSGTSGTNFLTIGGAIDAFSYNGAGGSGVNIQAGGNIQLGTLQTGASQGSTSGNIAIISTNGNVNLTQARSTINNVRSIGDIAATFTSDPSLDAIKQALTNLQTNVQAGLASSVPASNITLSAANGTIAATGNLDTYSQSGAAGSVAITSGTGLNLQNVASYGNTASGNLTITSQGAINAAAITTQANAGPSGSIAINGTSIATGNVSSLAGTGSGNITISGTQTVNIGNVTSSTNTGNSGNVTVTGTGNVTTGNVTSSTGGSGTSGNIQLESTQGSVTAGNVSTVSAGGNSGNIDIQALLDIALGNVTTQGGGSSGDIDLNAGRDLTAGDISSLAGTGDSGDISLTAGNDITTGNITSASEQGQSGDISLDAGGNISTGNITTQDGTISLDAGGSINTGSLTSENDVLVNGAILGETLPTTPEPIELPNTPEMQAAIERSHAIAVVQADSSLNPNAIITTSGSNIGTSTNTTSTTSLVESAQLDADTLSSLGAGLLSVPMSNMSLDSFSDLDNERSNEYTQQFGSDGNLSGSVTATRAAMARIEAETGYRTGVVYLSLRDDAVDISLLTADGTPQFISVPVSRNVLMQTLQNYRDNLVNARLRMRGQYNQYSEQLYNWLIAPIASELEARNIDTLMFSMDSGLRSLPIAALYDGEHYLIENYSLSLIPSMGLIDTRYQRLTPNMSMLAMGASEFQELPPLPGVPAELNTLTEYRWNGNVFLNEAFTRDNVINQRSRHSYPIVHLATHGAFNEGSLENSYIQLWDEKISLDQIRELGWNDPPVELLVLSACQTALGNADAEMGFAGLAVAAGVKTAIASLWYVSDAATFLLMMDLYGNLANAPIKAEALREAQLAMLRGEVRIEGNLLYLAGREQPIVIPENLQATIGQDFSNPYFWSAFTAIGSPW